MSLGRPAGDDAGATLVEYAIVLGALCLAAIPIVSLLSQVSGDYLIDTSEDIGRSRNDQPAAYTAPPAPPANWATTNVSSGPNLIANGSFETPDIADGTWAPVPSGSWSTSDPSGYIEIWGTGHGGVVSPAGGQHGELNLYGVTTYGQTVSVTVDSAYRWSVTHRARSDLTERAEVLINGSVVAVLDSGFGWEVYSGVFTAGSSTVTLELRSITGTGVGNLIDDIRLEEILP